MITTAALVARADQIDRRLGPITGRDADRIAVELREAAKVLAASQEVLQTSRGNIVSLRDAGLPGPLEEWLRIVDEAISLATPT